MKLTLSRRGDYVTRAALCLAEAWDGTGSYRKIREVSEAMEIPLSYTPQVLGLLSRAGIAEAKAGRDGGYRLLRDPEQITLLEVVEAGEGQLLSERCALRGGPCHWDDVCAFHPAWAKASEAIRDSLSKTMLAEIVQADRDLLAGKRIAEPPPKGHRVPVHGREPRKLRSAQVGAQ
jgi:Rrf2 family protein